MADRDLCICDDEEFDASLSTISNKDLVAALARFQDMMVQEQSQFNELSSRLAKLSDKEHPDYVRLSGELKRIQATLARLVQRTTRCFTQQASSQEKSVSKISKSPNNSEAQESSSVSALRSGSKLVNSKSDVNNKNKVFNETISEKVTNCSNGHNRDTMHRPAIANNTSESRSHTQQTNVHNSVNSDSSKDMKKVVRKNSSERAKAWSQVGKRYSSQDNLHIQKSSVKTPNKYASQDNLHLQNNRVIKPHRQNSLNFTGNGLTKSRDDRRTWKRSVSTHEAQPRHDSANGAENGTDKLVKDAGSLSWTESKLDTKVENDTLTITKTTVTKTLNYSGSIDYDDIFSDDVNIEDVTEKSKNSRNSLSDMDGKDSGTLSRPNEQYLMMASQPDLRMSSDLSLSPDNKKYRSQEDLLNIDSLPNNGDLHQTDDASEHRIKPVSEIMKKFESLKINKGEPIDYSRNRKVRTSSKSIIPKADKKVTNAAIQLTSLPLQTNTNSVKYESKEPVLIQTPTTNPVQLKPITRTPLKIGSTKEKSSPKKVNFNSVNLASASVKTVRASGPVISPAKPMAHGVNHKDQQYGSPGEDVITSGKKNGAVRSAAVSPSSDADVPDAGQDEKVKERVTLRTWDPIALLKELYELKLAGEDDGSATDMINIEGIMEKLPTNKKKATLLKTWKRRYFKLQDGHLYYYDESCPDPKNSSCDKAHGFFKLMGGSIEELGGRIMGIDDGRGRYLVVRCVSDDSYDKWRRALSTQIVDNMTATYIRPLLHANAHAKKKVLVVDIGSCSVRAGVLGEQPSLPTLFFPCVVATNKANQSRMYGMEAWRPDVRAQCTLTYPVRPSVTIDKGTDKPFSIDMETMPGLFKKIFHDLQLDPNEYWVMLSSPTNFNDNIKSKFLRLLLEELHVPGVNMVSQTLLALYMYNASSGIVVDVGERIEILPVTDGYMIEGGISRQVYGGNRVTEGLNNHLLSDNKFRFFTDVEFNIVRSLMEKTCYVAQDYNEEMDKHGLNPETCYKSLNLEHYSLPPDTWTHVGHDLSRFKSTEGLFNNDLWGMDTPSIQKLVHKAIQSCPMDVRREMARSIYLSGGTTLLPGFAERLESELGKLLPSSLVIKVHAGPERYHAAYIGACVMAGHPAFHQSSITAVEWKREGAKSLRKWHNF